MTDLPRRTLLAAAAGSLMLPGVALAAKAAKVGEAAPPFNVFTFDFKKINFNQMRGKVILLNYWATWCGPCKVELPLLSAYYNQNADKGLMMFAVKGDDPNGESRPNAALFPFAKSVSFPLVWHLNGDGYGPIDNSFPSNYVIDRAGVVRYAEAGAFETDSLDATLRPLLAEPKPTTPA